MDGTGSLLIEPLHSICHEHIARARLSFSLSPPTTLPSTCGSREDEHRCLSHTNRRCRCVRPVHIRSRSACVHCLAFHPQSLPLKKEQGCAQHGPRSGCEVG